MENKELTFHLEEYKEDTHSLTTEEIIEDLKQKKRKALESVREYRREYIENLLTKNNIDPQTVDIEKILDGQVPTWLLDLQKKTNQLEQQDDNKKKR